MLVVLDHSVWGFHQPNHRPPVLRYRNNGSPSTSSSISSYLTKTRFSVPLFATTQEESLERCKKIGEDRFQKYFDFPLDDWQLQAGGAMVEGSNVIVCAPTGAGKTVVGEMAVIYAYHYLKRKAAYTTPLKALSNQVFAKLSRMFPREDVGLSTGDISVHKGAPITVMTTEVYRNIAWRSSSTMVARESDDGETVISTDELADTAVCVLDELHYMGLPGRGSVWEESIITTPSDATQLIGLSATLSNAPALAAWMEHVTERKTVLIQVPSELRPVPLRYLFAVKEGLYPLFKDPDAGPGAPNGMLGFRESLDKERGFGEKTRLREQIPRGLHVNPILIAASRKRVEKVNRSFERQKLRKDIKPTIENEDDFRGRGRGRRYQPPRKISAREERKEKERLLRKEMRKSVPTLGGLLKRLEYKNLLPAIFFIFSRAGCDKAAESIVEQLRGPQEPNRLVPGDIGYDYESLDRQRDSRNLKSKRRDIIETDDGRSFRSRSNFINEDIFTTLLDENVSDDSRFNPSEPLSNRNWKFYSEAGLLDYDQVRAVASRISIFNEQNPEISFDDSVMEQLLFGVGSHHAGMLPAHKSFVEILFRNQLMKAVFATETLAAGINMPARTTVICSMAKRGDGSSMNLLETSNLLQMAGRAGRRGMDTDGTCVIVTTPFESHDEAAKILTDPIKPISSQFTPSYSLAVNLISRGLGRLDVAKQLVSKSFAMWEKKRLEASIDEILGGNEAMDKVPGFSAQERFMALLLETLEILIEQRTAKFDVARLKEYQDILLDREYLKQVSKSYVAARRAFEMEEVTLSHLESEKREREENESDIGLEEEVFIAEDFRDIGLQLEQQNNRLSDAAKKLRRHPFTTLASFINAFISTEDSHESRLLLDVLRAAREDSVVPNVEIPVSAEELSSFAKSFVVSKRKFRKLKESSEGLSTKDMLEPPEQTGSFPDNSWNDMLAITKTLSAYGCLTPNSGGVVDVDSDVAMESYSISQAGVNIGMLGFENSLWALVALGGAWNVLDVSPASRSSYTEESVSDDVEVSASQAEARKLRERLLNMDAAEFSGYVSCIVSEGVRNTNAPSVMEVFHQLTPDQQRAVQSSLQSMDRLMQVQRQYSVDERSCVCNL